MFCESVSVENVNVSVRVSVRLSVNECVHTLVLIRNGNLMLEGVQLFPVDFGPGFSEANDRREIEARQNGHQ